MQVHSARPLAALRALIVLPALLAVAACSDSAPTDVGPAPVPVEHDTDLDSVFGPSARAIAHAQQAQREALAQAAESALVAATAAGLLPSARLAAAASPASAAAVDPATPAPFTFSRSETRQGGTPDAPWEVSTTTTLDATVVDGTLSIVGTERSVARDLNRPNESLPKGSTVTEMHKRLDVAVCPDASGRSAGTWTSSERTWRVRSSTELAGPASHDGLVEQTAHGTTTAHVNDLAEIETYDLDIRYAARKMRGPGNRPIDRRATFHIVRTGVTPANLRRQLASNMVVESTGDVGSIEVNGLGPLRFHIGLTERVQTAYGRARRAWRNGLCVEVVPVRGSAGGPLAPGATASVGPDARHKQDGSTITVGTHAARASSGTVAAPTSGVAHPAAFRFTMPATGGARVDLTHVSRRGIGFGQVVFTEANDVTGHIDYQATASFTIGGTDDWGQTVSGGLTSQATIASEFTLEHERTEHDGERWYRVLAENRISLGGGGELTGTIDGWKVTYGLSLDGEGVSHNPWRAGDVPIVEHRIITPYQRRPSHGAGQLRLYVRDGKPHYDLRLNVNPIAPGFTATRRTDMECPEGGWGTATARYDNASHATTVTVQDPEKCIRSPGSSTTDDSPYLFGAISTNWFENDPTTGSNAMVSGTYERGATTISGETTHTFTSCERVTYLDPTQLGQFALGYSGFPMALSFIRQGQCSLTYTIRWSFPLPA